MQNNQNYDKKPYTKFFVSTKRNDKPLYFKVDYETSLFKTKDILDFSIVLNINYLNFRKPNCSHFNKWVLFSISSYDACTFDHSIMIEPDYRSFGIGSFLLNEILSEANKHIPNYSLRADLFFKDAEGENKGRRDSLYKNIGFDVSENEISIDKISSLNLNRTFDYITEVENPIHDEATI
jgi:GNAT superfamily N-acetyltransferase